MKKILICLISFYYTATIQTMSENSFEARGTYQLNEVKSTNERPYHIFISDEVRINYIMLLEYRRRMLHCTNSSVQAAIYYNQLHIVDTQMSINIHTHEIAATCKVALYPFTNYSIIDVITRVFSMKEFCEITNTQVSNAGSMYR
ncbi:MAG TPA: hypothetical protein VLG50_04095 [Candidatus Saccharimonadales bacterium]|nr:hypothetical protein [Candidatus Saccharimonadales bacterium]